MQGGAATLARDARNVEYVPDLILATDMLNLPAFLALTRDLYAHVPVALYCHENQLTYPCRPDEKRDLTYAVMNWLSMLSADKVYFNSAYHLGVWFEEIPRLLKHFPDYGHLSMLADVRAKSAVLPVGCDLSRFGDAPTKIDPQKTLFILWNQRWEYDKDPVTFFRALDALVDAGIPFRVALAGSNERQMPEEFLAARERLGDRVVHYGRADPDTYVRLLRQADVVVSTALHEFFGIAIVEAIYCGCFPVLPRRLSYPEIIPSEYHKECLYGTFEGLVERLQRCLTRPSFARRIAKDLREEVRLFDWSVLATRYDDELEQLMC
jgi:glycosyltransferase involved in cell wall biosynthesis